MLPVLRLRDLAERVLLRLLTLQDALALTSCCQETSRLQFRPLALDVSAGGSASALKLDLRTLEALRFQGYWPSNTLPKLRDLDAATAVSCAMPMLETLRCRTLFEKIPAFVWDVFRLSPRLHTLVLPYVPLCQDDVRTLAAQAPGLRRLVCRRLLSASLACLCLEELAVHGEACLRTCFPSTLHTLRLDHVDLDPQTLACLNIPELRRLSLYAQGSRRVYLPDLLAAGKLQTLRLCGFVIQTPAHKLVLPANLDTLELKRCIIRSRESRANRFCLEGNPRLKSFTMQMADGCPCVSARGTSLHHLELGHVHLSSGFLEHIDPTGLQSLVLTASSMDGAVWHDVQPAESLETLALGGLVLDMRWCEHLACWFPKVRDLTISVNGYGGLQPGFARLLGQLRALRLKVMGSDDFVRSVLGALGPDLRELSITGSLPDGDLESLVPEPVAAGLSSLQLGARRYWDYGTRVMPRNFIARDIDAELGY